MKIEVFWNDVEPKRAEAVLFGLWSPADDCRDVLRTLDRLRPEGKRWTFDMVLTATLGEPPARIGRFATERTDAWNSFLDYRLEHVLPYSPFTALANGTGQPATSLPLWWNDAGLPVGTHLMARSGDDDVLLQLSAQLEDAEPWFHRRPAR